MPVSLTSSKSVSTPAASSPGGVSCWARTRYRLGQFLHGWRAEVTAADRAEVAALLAPPALALFEQMPTDAQAHSLRVLHTLRAEDLGLPDDVAAAALLHDVGKVAAIEQGAYLGLWLRGPIVLVEAVRPAWLRHWASPAPGPTLRYAIYVQLEHAGIGAERAAAVGCSLLTCQLIAHHQDVGVPALPGPAGDPAAADRLRRYLVRLQDADNRN